jgi:hypothetical protein
MCIRLENVFYLNSAIKELFLFHFYYSVFKHNLILKNLHLFQVKVFL